jgi:hypothetical protein
MIRTLNSKSLAICLVCFLLTNIPVVTAANPTSKEDSQKVSQSIKPVAKPVARIAAQMGTVMAISRDGKSRELLIGGPVYEGDSIETGEGSHTIINFIDKTRISLNRDTLFTVEKHEYDSGKSDTGSALFSLFRGGLRALTGLIGKINPKGFTVKTPVVTIGIRGTGFDLACQGSCISSGGNLGSAIEVGQADGLYASTWDGVIELNQGSVTQLLEAGQTVFLANGLTAPIVVPQIPSIIQQFMAPRPDLVSTPGLSEAITPDAINEESDVKGDDGHVILENENEEAKSDGYNRTGFYLGIAGGKTGSLNGASGPIDIGIIDEEASGKTRRAYAGYRFNKILSLELSQYDLGEVNININGTFTDPNLFADEALNELPYLVRGTSLTANILIPLGISTERFTLFLKGGAMVWEGDIEATIDGHKFVKTVNGESSIIGLGMALNLGDYVSFRFDIDRIDLDPDPLVVGTAGIMLQF